MIWLCVEPERREKTSRIMVALARGLKGKGRCIVGPPPKGEPFVIWGHRWLAEKVCPTAQAAGTPWWLIDNGWHLPANGTPTGYYTLTYRGPTPARIEAPDTVRLAVSMRPWQERRSGYVLIALPGEYHGRMLGEDMPAWSRDIVDRVRAHTKREIIVRQKGTARSLSEDMAGAFCLVTHSSKASIAAIIKGVPCVVDPSAAAAPVARTRLEDIENPAMPSRETWWASLMCQQFSLDEMRHGLPSRWVFCRHGDR